MIRGQNPGHGFLKRRRRRRHPGTPKEARRIFCHGFQRTDDELGMVPDFMCVIDKSGCRSTRGKSHFSGKEEVMTLEKRCRHNCGCDQNKADGQGSTVRAIEILTRLDVPKEASVRMLLKWQHDASGYGSRKDYDDDVEKAGISFGIALFAVLMCLLIFFSEGKGLISATSVGTALRFGGACFLLVRSIHLLESICEKDSYPTLGSVLLLEKRRYVQLLSPAGFIIFGEWLSGIGPHFGFDFGTSTIICYAILEFFVSRKRIRQIRQNA